MPSGSHPKNSSGAGGPAEPYSADGLVSATDAAVAIVLAAARRFAEQVCLSSGARERFLIIVEEIVTNIIEHSQPPAGSDIAYRFEAGADSLAMTFVDKGLEFDPRQAAPGLSSLESEITEDSDAPSLVEGGRGWLLVTSWCRIVDYHRIAEGNRLELNMPLS